MTTAIERFDEKYGLHDNNDGGKGKTVAVVVDRRCVLAHGHEMRLAVTLGDNTFPSKTPKEWLTLFSATGKLRFAVHVVGTTGRSFRVFYQWIDDQQVDDSFPVERAEQRAREILASISDAEYLKRASEMPVPRDAVLTVVEPLPLDGYVFLHDSEPDPEGGGT